MARIRMITRTVVSTVFTVMAVNEDTKQVENVCVIVPSATTMTDKQLDKAIKDGMPHGYLFVQVISSEKCETLYGMSEEEFIRIARILPPRSTTEE